MSYKHRKTANAVPLKKLVREMVFTYIQSTQKSAVLNRVMKNCFKKGIVKNPDQFRKWIVDECCKTVQSIDAWLIKQTET